MKSARNRFNLLLAVALVVSVVAPGSLSVPRAAAASAADGTSETSTNTAAKSAKKKKKKKTLNALRVHVEAKRELAERSLPVQVGRSSPLSYTIEKMPILNESHLERASIVEQPGGFQVRVKFNSLGAKILESYTAAAAGRHLILVTDIEGETRWLAAPLIRQRIADGTLAFSPDATLAEMTDLVDRLNHDIEKARKQWLDR